MENTSKIRVTQSYEKLSEALQEQIKLVYPNGFSQHLIAFKDRDGNTIKGLRFETDEKIYLVRMTTLQAENIVTEDEDFDENGNLKDDAKMDYEDKHAEIEYLGENDNYQAEEEDE